MDEEVGRRLSAAYASGSMEALERWAATGRPGVLLLREFLDGTWDPAPATGAFSRDLMDNTTALVAEIAEAEPEAFLEVFEAERFHANTLVLVGLGRIDDSRATRRLARVAGSTDNWARMDVAIGLGRRASPIATTVLVGLLGDDDYLVRYHALRSLERIGEAAALPGLAAFVAQSPIEAELASKAIASIVDRSAEGDPSG
jgi:HEAT repeat protein